MSRESNINYIIIVYTNECPPRIIQEWSLDNVVSDEQALKKFREYKEENDSYQNALIVALIKTNATAIASTDEKKREINVYIPVVLNNALK